MPRNIKTGLTNKVLKDKRHLKKYNSHLIFKYLHIKTFLTITLRTEENL